LEALPITSSGKVDHRALPAPEGDRPDLDQDFVAPRTETETVLAGIFAELLGLDRVGANDSFFELGGSSLQATQVISRIQNRSKVLLPLRRVFEAPTVAALAGMVDQEVATLGLVAEEERLLREIDQMSDEEVERLLADERRAGGA